jgi:hypothetical protein
MTANNRSYTITIPNPREDLQKAEIEAVMDMIIEKDVFFTRNGALTGKRDARVVDTTVNDLYDPPRL